MKARMDRREFVKRCVATGVGIIAAPALSKALQTSDRQAQYELCSVVGDRYFDNTMKAVDALGGIRRFVQQGNTVGILINSPFDGPGTYTNPDISLAVVKMCLDAGAKQIYALHDTQERYWRQSTLYGSMKADIGRIRHPGEMIEVKIDKGKALKAAEVSRTLLSSDVFINIPIIKDHEGTRYTCTMKNMMGTCSSSTCRRFHFGDSPGVFNLFKGYYSNVDLLAQSIADVHFVRRPDLCVVDATVILATNGPSGPGEVRRPREVIAATNCVAADMYAARHLGLNWEDLKVITCAQQHGFGPETMKEIRIITI